MKYTWKHGITILSNRTLDSHDKPLEVGTLLTDLCNGEKYRVMAISKAKEHDRIHPMLPDDVVHTMPAGKCSDEELQQLREKAKYTFIEGCEPFADVVF
jgi:hypothetical protein